MNRYVAMALAVLFIPVAAAAQDATAFSQLQFLLQPGYVIIVTDPRGISTKGTLETITRSELTLRTGKILRVYPRQDVLEVKRQYSDPVRDGVKKGLLVGMALGLVIGVQATKSPNYHGEAPGAPIGGAVIGSIYGAAIGLIADSIKKTDQSLYRAPGAPGRVRLLPLLSEDQKGMALNISF
jgi:hypothetical protein